MIMHCTGTVKCFGILWRFTVEIDATSKTYFIDEIVQAESRILAETILNDSSFDFVAKEIDRIQEEAGYKILWGRR